MGQEANSPYFNSSLTGAKIQSIAIEVWPSSGNFVTIDVLRSDGTLFYGSAPWPIDHAANINLIRSPDPQPPPTPRSIAFVYGYGLVVTDKNNQQWLQAPFPSYAWQLVSGNVVLVAGNQTSGQSIALYGTTGNSLSIVPFTGSAHPPDLPGVYGNLLGGYTDPNSSFIAGQGKSMPLAAGKSYAWAAMSALQCAQYYPCIVRSTFNGQAYGPWYPVNTGAYDSYIGSPQSIQDGQAMRNAGGEIWIIGNGSSRVFFYAP